MKKMFYYTHPAEEDVYHELGEFENAAEASRFAPEEDYVTIWEDDAGEPTIYFLNGSWFRS